MLINDFAVNKNNFIISILYLHKFITLYLFCFFLAGNHNKNKSLFKNEYVCFSILAHPSGCKAHTFSFLLKWFFFFYVLERKIN